MNADMTRQTCAHVQPVRVIISQLSGYGWRLCDIHKTEHTLE